MEVPLTPGKTASLITLITEVLVLVSTLALVRTLNALGRWKLYRSGRVDMNMHFHDMGPLSALWYAFRERKVSRFASALLCFQATLSIITIALMISAPRGLSESRNYRVDRNHTVPGDSLCRTNGQAFYFTRLGEATERVRKHFESGGSILRVGRTGRNADALIMEDEEFSLGPTLVVDEFRISVSMKVSNVGPHPHVELDESSFIGRSDLLWNSYHSFGNRTYTEGKLVIDGPYYFMYSVGRLHYISPYEMDLYSFAKCDVSRLELKGGESEEARGNCAVANLQRNAVLGGNWLSLSPHTAPWREMEKTYLGLNLSELGIRSIMIMDLAVTLSRDSCEDSYVAYLPSAEISRTSVILICTLGGIAFASLLATALSLLFTRRTFNWNGSYQRIFNLLASSDSVGLKTGYEIGTAPEVDIVIELANRNLDSPTYDFHAIPREAGANPVPKAKFVTFNVTSITDQ